VLIEVILHHAKYTEIKLTNIQGFRRICFLLLLGRGLKMEVYLAPAGPKGCQVPHFSRYYNRVKQSRYRPGVAQKVPGS